MSEFESPSTGSFKIEYKTPAGGTFRAEGTAPDLPFVAKSLISEISAAESQKPLLEARASGFRGVSTFLGYATALALIAATGMFSWSAVRMLAGGNAAAPSTTLEPQTQPLWSK